MSRDDGYTRYTVRIPTPLYERVKEAAGEASVNSLLVATLEEKYPAPDADFERLLLLLERAMHMKKSAKTQREAKLANSVLARVEAEFTKLFGSPLVSDNIDDLL